MTDKRIYEELKNSIDIPVYDASYQEIFKVMKSHKDEIHKSSYYGKGNGGRTGGLYNFKTGPKYIFIYKYTPFYSKIWMLLHEYKHYLCHSNECFCWDWNPDDKEETDYAREYCAGEYCLEQCLKNEYIHSLYDLFKNMVQTIPLNNVYGRVYRELSKMDLWFETMDLLKKHNLLQKPIKNTIYHEGEPKRKYKMITRIEEC